MSEKSFQILEWDTSFFGFKVAIINKSGLIDEQLAEILFELKKSGVVLVYFPAKNRIEHFKNSFNNYNGYFVSEKVTYIKKPENIST